MSADTHTLPVAMDEAGRLFINHRLCFSEALGGFIPGEPVGVALRWLRLDPDGWFSIGLPAVAAKPGDSDALKASGLRRVRLYGTTVDGRLAKEDAADFNHCHDWELHCDHIWSAQRYVATIKGGSRRFKVVVGCQHGHGRETDWDFGNFADQGNARTTAGSLTVLTEDRSPVAVRYLTADPVLLGPPSQIFDVLKLNQGWFYPLFNFLKDLLRPLGIRL